MSDQTNAVGTLVLFQATYPLLTASTPSPKFIPISSGAGNITDGTALPVGALAYGSSKAALNYLARKLHFEYGNLSTTSATGHKPFRDPSSLRFISASGSTPIDWTRVPEASKKALTESYGYNRETDNFKPLPVTVADLAKMFDESKFFGYFESNLLTTLMDISEFGLQAATPTVAQVGPRFYMKYLDQLWFLLFAPGKRDCIMGYSDDTIWQTEVDDSKMAADEAAMAQEFDVKLEQEVSRGMGRLVDITKKLCGWHAWTLQSSLESSQFTDAIWTLPPSHPLHAALLSYSLRPR